MLVTLLRQGLSMNLGFADSATLLAQKLQLGQQSCTLLIQALGRQRQVDLCEFKASLVYTASSRIAGTIQRALYFLGGREPGDPATASQLCGESTNPHLAFGGC